MIKQSLKNYFKCLKYIFTPLGVIALGLIIGLSILIPGVINAGSETVEKIIEISDKSIDLGVLFDGFTDAVKALDWSDIGAALSKMFSKEWLSAVFEDNINAFIGDVREYGAQISAAVATFIDSVIKYIVILCVFIAIGFVVGYFFTKWIIRRDIAKRRFGMFAVKAVTGGILTAAITALCMWLATLWSYSVYISAPISFLLAAFVILTEAYVVHGYKKIPFGKIVNIKNAAKLFLSDLIIFAFTVVFIILIMLITNTMVAIFVAIGFIDITLAVLDMNAESYVKTAVAKGIPEKNADDSPVEINECSAA